MSEKKRICFVAANRITCDQVSKQLHNLLGNFITVDTWCLMETQPSDLLKYDMFIAATQPVYQQIFNRIPAGKKFLTAYRTLETKNLEEILSLPSGTEVLLISSFERTTYENMKLLKNFAIDNIVLHPLWSGKESYPKHVKIALTTGQQPVPPEIEKVIDLGVRPFDLSTFVELIVELNLPREFINEISTHYISTIISMVTRRLKIAEQSQKLKTRLEVVLSTVDHGIIAIDEAQHVCLFNPAAEKMLGLSIQEVIGKPIKDVLPEITLFIANNPSPADTVTRIGYNHFVINTTPTQSSHDHNISGLVVSLKETNEVQKLDSKVRRELKRDGNVAKHNFNDIVGTSQELMNSVAMAKKFAITDLTILIEGESGSGKELFAQSIHNASGRRKAPFVAINFAALPESLVESELFGYEDGAFTGARKGGKPGLFEEAHTGTIFLDEIGDASLEVQKRLLRVLEEKEVRRVGGNIVTPVDVRVIAATNRKLKQLVKEGTFRQDLYFRLCTIPIAVAPLSKRKTDILALLDFFAYKLYNRRLRLDYHTCEYLINYEWPGNVRELQNITKFLCGMVGPHEEVNIRHLPAYLLEGMTASDNSAVILPANKDVTKVISELSRLGPLEPLLWVLSELKRAEKYECLAGRNSIAMALTQQQIPCTEHKVRFWLKRLEQSGCITTRVTKQGTRLTKLGEDILAFWEASKASIQQ